MNEMAYMVEPCHVPVRMIVFLCVLCKFLMGVVYMFIVLICFNALCT